MLLKIGCICLLVFYFTTQSSAYFVTVDAHAEECFFDKVEEGTKMGKKINISKLESHQY